MDENDGYDGQRLSNHRTLASDIGKYIITILRTEPIIFNELIKIMNTQHQLVQTVKELKGDVQDLKKSMETMSENISLLMEQRATPYRPIPLKSVNNNVDPRPAPYVDPQPHRQEEQQYHHRHTDENCQPKSSDQSPHSYDHSCRYDDKQSYNHYRDNSRSHNDWQQDNYTDMIVDVIIEMSYLYMCVFMFLCINVLAMLLGRSPNSYCCVV